MAQPSSHSYHVAGGYEIALAEAGPTGTAKDAPPVVFIHGSGPGASGISNFRGNMDAFTTAGYRVILPDLIGYGASSKPEGIDYTLELFTATLKDALRQHGISRSIMIGNSLGGGIAIQAALDDPDCASALILMAPGCLAEQAEYFTMPGIAKMKSAFGSDDFSREEQRALIANLLHPDWADRIPEALVEERFAVARTQPKDVLARMKTPNLAPRLGELSCPIFVMWGADDQFCPASHGALFLEHCRDARVMTFTRTGHWVQLERPGEFNTYAIGFCDECG